MLEMVQGRERKEGEGKEKGKQSRAYSADGVDIGAVVGADRWVVWWEDLAVADSGQWLISS